MNEIVERKEDAMTRIFGPGDSPVDTSAAEATPTDESVVSRHWPACSGRTGVIVEGVASDRLRGIIRDLCDLRIQVTLGRTADAKVLGAITALRAAENVNA